MTKDERNIKIYEWLHPDTEVLVPDVKRPYRSDSEYIGKHAISLAMCPDFGSKEGFWLLLEGLKGKGHEVCMAWEGGRWGIDVYPGSMTTKPYFEAYADTLPEALVAAVLKVIDAEDKDVKQR